MLKRSVTHQIRLWPPISVGISIEEIPTLMVALFSQTVNNTGVDENGVITASDGFIPGEPILSSDKFSNINTKILATAQLIVSHKMTFAPFITSKLEDQ